MIRSTRPTRLNDDERHLWVLNDEGLYLMWKHSRLPLKQFIRENRADIDVVIRRALNLPPLH